MVEASREVLDRAGGPWESSLNHYRTSMLGLVTTVQVDEFVFVVGPDDFHVKRVGLDCWIQGDAREAAEIECDTAEQAWELLRHVREGCLLWQCGACDAWLFTSNRPRIGVLNCSTCGDGGIDFRHADRGVGESS
jgi:hypothetical protein